MTSINPYFKSLRRNYALPQQITVTCYHTIAQPNRNPIVEKHTTPDQIKMRDAPLPLPKDHAPIMKVCKSPLIKMITEIFCKGMKRKATEMERITIEGTQHRSHYYS